jgi:hypothetical protein
MNNFGEKVASIWSVADLLRDAFKRSKYPDVILPLTVLPQHLLAVQHRRGDVHQLAALEEPAAADVFDAAVGGGEVRQAGGGVGRVITEQPQELS